MFRPNNSQQGADRQDSGGSGGSAAGNNNNTPEAGGSTPSGRPAPDDQIDRFVILQFGNGPQQDVIIDYRDNIRNAIVEQRQRQASVSRSGAASGPAAVGVQQQQQQQVQVQQQTQTPVMSASTASGSPAQQLQQQAAAPAVPPLAAAPRPEQQPAQQSPPAAPQGVRGIDFPAFDVTTEGVYADQRTTAGRLLDFLHPSPAPAATPANTGATASPTAQASPATSSVSPATATNTSTSTATATRPPPHPSSANRNIVLTVNYEYSSGIDHDHASNRSASLVLNVPNVPQGEDENRLQALIRFATIIAFRTIAMSLQNKQRGVSEEQFAKLPAKRLDEIDEKECPICYDPFEEPSSKRKRDDGDDDTENKTKLHRGVDGATDAAAPEPQKQDGKRVVEVQYSHIPVQMPCKHVFGQDCLHEWLKSNNSCPLCRHKLFEETRNSDGIQTTTMNLPNLAAFLNDNSRDSLLNGEINRLPMLVVSNDSDPAAAAELLNNDLRNSFNSVPIILTTAPTGIPNVVAAGGAPGSFANLANAAGAAPISGPVLSNVTRDNIVRRIISSLTNSVGGGYASSFASGPTSALGHVFRASNAHAANVSRTLPRPSGEFVNRDPLFPVGVSSRRTANGVETVNIGQNGDQPNSEDLAIQNSIVNDLIFGALGRGASRNMTILRPAHSTNTASSAAGTTPGAPDTASADPASADQAPADPNTPHTANNGNDTHSPPSND